jgi:hypothetical protein
LLLSDGLLVYKTPIGCINNSCVISSNSLDIFPCHHWLIVFYWIKTPIGCINCSCIMSSEVIQWFFHLTVSEALLLISQIRLVPLSSSEWLDSVVNRSKTECFEPISGLEPNWRKVNSPWAIYLFCFQSLGRIAWHWFKAFGLLFVEPRLSSLKFQTNWSFILLVIFYFSLFQSFLLFLSWTCILEL